MHDKNKIVKNIFDLIDLAEQHRLHCNDTEYEECVLEAVIISRNNYKRVSDDLERAYIDALNKAVNCYINFGDDDIAEGKIMEDYNKSIEFANEALDILNDKDKLYPGAREWFNKAIEAVNKRIKAL